MPKDLPKIAKDPATGRQVETVSETIDYQRYGRILNRTVKYPDGQEHSFDIWTKNWRSQNEFIIVVPFDSMTHTFWILDEFYPAGHMFCKGLPAGNVDVKHGGAVSAAQSEMKEEANLVGGTYINLLEDEKTTMLQDKYQQDFCYMYLCVDPKEEDDDEERKKNDAAGEMEELITVHKGIEVHTVMRWIRAGLFQTNQATAMLLAMEKLRELKYL